MKKYQAVIALDFLPPGAKAPFVDPNNWCGYESHVEEVEARGPKAARRKFYRLMMRKCDRQIGRLKKIEIYSMREVIEDGQEKEGQER